MQCYKTRSLRAEGYWKNRSKLKIDMVSHGNLCYSMSFSFLWVVKQKSHLLTHVLKFTKTHLSTRIPNGFSPPQHDKWVFSRHGYNNKNTKFPLDREASRTKQLYLIIFLSLVRSQFCFRYASCWITFWNCPSFERKRLLMEVSFSDQTDSLRLSWVFSDQVYSYPVTDSTDCQENNR